MGICHYLFNKETKEGINLGKRGKRIDFEFQGPVCFVNDKRYLLPPKYLNLLIERFKQTGDEKTILIIEDYELLDTFDYLKEDEDLIKIGGDRYFDLPLEKYLPELDSPEVQKEIGETGILIG